MTKKPKKMPYEFGRRELPSRGEFVTEESAYPLVKSIEELLYPAGRVGVIPAMVDIHKEIRLRMDQDDIEGDPVDLVDADGVKVDEVLTLKSSSVRRIARSILEHYGN